MQNVCAVQRVSEWIIYAAATILAVRKLSANKSRILSSLERLRCVIAIWYLHNVCDKFMIINGGVKTISLNAKPLP